MCGWIVSLKVGAGLPFYVTEMSFTGDLLTATTPARFFRQRGTWVLETVRFVPVDRDVFQPRTQRLEGNEAILQHLKRGENAALVAATQHLMRGLPVDEDQVFEAQDGEWIPCGRAEREAATSSGTKAAHTAASELAELRAELLILRVSHERVRERVLRLEAQSQRLPFEPTRSSREAAALESLALLGRAEAARASAPPPLARTQEAAPPAGESLPPPVRPRAEPRIKFPPVPAINTCLRALISDKITVKEKKLAVFAAAPEERYWVSRLIDDDGIEAGMILADAVATASLGGMLMMLPDQEVNEQRKAREPSEDAIEAMSEVSNTLSAVFNQLPEAIRVRVKPIEPLSNDATEWLAIAEHKTQIEIVGGLGNLYFFSR